ncbi:MAG: YeeE/YedE family protein [SAR202 cluster bacterium]|nr:hypothetical protein [Chloroflexota bacterium]MQG87126.1 YeeE/YedE family protein [SAR202 cluster bacterium]
MANLIIRTENIRGSKQRVLGWSFFLAIILAGFAISLNNFSDAAIWITASALGFILQKSRFCFASAFRDLFLFGSGHNMKAVLFAMAIASVGFVGILVWILPDPLPGEFPSSAHVLPFGLSTIIAGSVFGIGMVLAGGCVSGTIYRIAEGYVASIVTMIGIFTGTILLIISWDFWWDTFISNEPKIFLPSTQSIGYGFSLLLTLLGIGAVYLIVIYVESKSGIIEFISAKTQNQNSTGFQQRILENINNVVSRSWTAKSGGIALGFIAIIYFLFHSPPGVTGEIMKQSMNISAILNLTDGPLKGIASLSGCLGSSIGSGVISHTFVSTVGVFSGALVSALLSQEFKIRTPKEPKRYIQSMTGGILMGYSASLGIGCTIGAFFSAIPSLSLSGWLFGLSLGLGAFVGTKLIKAIG